jgi:molybdopterin converting factor subunit 1
MRVSVQLFARLRELAGRAALECDVPDDATIADVWRAVAAAHPALAPFGSSVSCARNEDFARMRTPVREGDAIAFLPPVSGGAPEVS